MKTIVVFTQSYPYSLAGEASFLEPEIAALQSVFDRVILVPRLTPRTPAPASSDSQVDLSLAQRLSGGPASLLAKGLSAITAPAFYRELVGNWVHTRRPRGVARAFAFTGMAQASADWAQSFLASRKDAGPLVLYTYWMNFITEGLADLRRRGRLDLPLATRAHGWDLYEERRDPPYIPYRGSTVQGVSKVCAISEHGLNYLRSRHPHASQRFELHRLGVPESGIASRPSVDGTWRILSCAFAVPVKRLPLLARAMLELARHCPQQPIEWSHIGDGPELPNVRSMVEDAPGNLTCAFTGTLNRRQVLEFYEQRPIDLFVNVSENEGLPVSIMECQRSGVPVVATDVGGTSEIVNDDVGKLIPVDLTAGQIASEMRVVLLDPATGAQRRQQSVVNWRQRFQAEVNYRRFADALASLC